MAHARKQIRDAVKTILDASGIAAGNIKTSRVHNIADSKLPAVLIYTPSEDSERISAGADSKFFRNVDLSIRLVASGTNLDDALDALATIVEEQVTIAAINTQLDPGRIVKFDLAGMETELQEGGDTPIGNLTVSYELAYITKETNPQTME